MVVLRNQNSNLSFYLVPEPTTASHAALVHMVVATRIVAYFFNVWLPDEMRRQLHLGSVIATTGDFPRRDHIARVYLSVSRAVQMICTVYGLYSTPASTLPSNAPSNASPPPAIIDLAKPLTGLLLLLQSQQTRVQPALSRCFYMFKKVFISFS